MTTEAVLNLLDAARRTLQEFNRGNRSAWYLRQIPIFVRALYEARHELQIFWRTFSQEVWPHSTGRYSHVSPFEYERRLERICRFFEKDEYDQNEREMYRRYCLALGNAYLAFEDAELDAEDAAEKDAANKARPRPTLVYTNPNPAT